MALSQAQKDALRARRQARTVEPAEDVSRETPQEEEHSYTRADEQKDIANGAYYNQLAQEQLSQIEQEAYNDVDPDELEEVESIPWQSDSSQLSSMLAPIEPMQLVRGFTVKPGMTPEQLEDLSEMIHTYIGVIPRKIGNYAGRWVRVIGCVVQPTSGMKNIVNRETGEVTQQFLKWDIPLFKLASIDQDTGMHIVMSGGGRYGLQFAMEMTALFGPGDWKHPRMVFVSQEERTGVDEYGHEGPRRMYRFNHRRPTSEDK